MFIPTQKAQLFCLLPAKELYELFCLVFFLIRKQEKLDKKPGKMKQENNNHSEIWNLCSIDLSRVQIDLSVVRVSQSSGEAEL